MSETEHFDVLIVGAGISGVGSAYHLQQQSPGKTFVLLDALDDFGGTWRTHTYPGVRSDSDLYTFGYRFKPWVGTPIATGGEILKYVGEVIEENDIARHIRYRHKITAARWSSETNLWTIEAERTDTNERVRFTANFLWMCQGYYGHAEGYTPDWPGLADFKGQLVHPQHWPRDLDYKGKRVVVIGSGATAATLIPSIADDVAHVTMLQRSPTYMAAGRNVDDMADQLRALEIDETWIHEIVRRQRLKTGQMFTNLALAYPDAAKEQLVAGVAAIIGPELAAQHFSPRYKPWTQRIAFVPDGDLFKKVNEGKASVVTDEIERFVAGGIRLKSGKTLEADIIVTATGFKLSVLGDIAFEVDGQPVDMADTVGYRGMMFTGVPNLVWVFGYFRASWTLRVDIMGDFVCRLLNHMDAKGVARVTVALRPEDAGLERLPWIDPENFNPGYLSRDMHRMPRRLDKPEWRHTQDYWSERVDLPAIDLDGPEFVYGGKVARPQAVAAE
ncbi:MAG TPA: NAD(P)/FAD-dependent oxidoreductase [Caulobacteraceae bacterium]